MQQELFAVDHPTLDDEAESADRRPRWNTQMPDAQREAAWLKLGEWVLRHYRKGFDIEESPGVIRGATMIELNAGSDYRRHRDELIAAENRMSAYKLFSILNGDSQPCQPARS